MAFPTTTVKDNFNRADGDVGSNWTADPLAAAYTNPDVASNQLKADGSNPFSAAYYNVSTYGPDCEVWATIPVDTTNLCRLMLGITSVGSGANWYDIEFDTTSSYVSKCVAGSRATIQNFGINFAAGDKIGLERIGTTLRAYRDSGGGWAQIGSDMTDSAVTGAGYLGLWIQNDTTVRFDDFGGGTVSAGSGAPSLRTIQSGQRW